MNWQMIRWSTLGLLLGLWFSLAQGCAKKCGPETCAGCCSSSNECVTQTNATACGTQGAACSACTSGQTCESGTCRSTDLLSDGGSPDAGPPRCTTDFDCRVAQNGSVCDSRTGVCVAGKGCSRDNQCLSSDPANKCYEFGAQCMCDTHDAPQGFTGTCRLRKGPCEVCATDAECGSDPIVFSPPYGYGIGACRALPNDTSGTKYCRYQRVGAMCQCGVDDGSGYCIPQTNSCSAPGCMSDKDCGANAVCTTSGGACGVCVPRCRWDFLTQELAAPGCPSNQTCWVDSENLDPASAYYGSGRCHTPCTSESDCAQSTTNPHGGPNLTCAGEKLASGALTDLRCRAKGECMDSLECPDLPVDNPSLGYCDRASLKCKQDCRIGSDPVTGNAYRDCKFSFACSNENGANVCKQQSCMQQGGAAIACGAGRYCCGEDKNGDGVADPCPPSAEQDLAGCYAAPSPPFCTKCTDDNGCASPTMPSWLTCPQGAAKNPSCSPLPNKCLEVPDYKGNTVKVCAPASYNDNSFTPNNRPRSAVACPNGYTAQFLVTAPNPKDGDLCQSDTDCQMGTTQGRCSREGGPRLPDAGLQKVCVCTGGSGTSQCPTGSQCHTATAGTPTYCIDSVVCTPGTLVSKPTTAGGCGF